QGVNVLRFQIGQLFFQPLQKLVLSNKSHLRFIRSHEFIERLFLDPIAFGVGQVSAQVSKSLLNDTLFVADIDDRVLPFVLNKLLSVSSASPSCSMVRCARLSLSSTLIWVPMNASSVWACR